MSPQLQPIRSKDNPRLQRLRRLGRDASAYREEGVAWIEGDHLCRAFLHKGGVPVEAYCSETFLAAGAHRDLVSLAGEVSLFVVPDALFKFGSGLAAPTGIGYLVRVQAAGDGHATAAAQHHSVVLDRLQDAGNVGSILRSAAAMGVRQVLALKGTVALWSPKVIRAGMGAHFSLRLCEGLTVEDLARLDLALVATSSHGASPVHQTPLPYPCAWVVGHEGQGVNADLIRLCQQIVTIPQPGGEESLNAAAAAAICFYESARQRHL